MEELEDVELARLVREREGEEEIPVRLEDPARLNMEIIGSIGYARSMKTLPAIPDDKAIATDVASEADYEAWTKAKVVEGLRQAEDRARMIPENQVWRELGLER